jgi:hypothetical protein
MMMHSKSDQDEEAVRAPRRSVRFEYPLAILFAVTHDLLHLDLQLGGAALSILMLTVCML